jgi:energy-coupling factor transporter ATP-binding protein EcfA2
VSLDDIAVIVGKNESGKTSLLKALSKFKPFKEDPYSLDREWPRGKRKDRDENFEVVTCRFDFSAREQDALSSLDPSCEGLAGVELGRTYKGKWTWRMQPHTVSKQRTGPFVQRRLANLVEEEFIARTPQVQSALKDIIAAVTNQLGVADTETAKKLLLEVKGQLVEVAKLKEHPELAGPLGSQCDAILTGLSESLSDLVWKLVISWVPTFIYMDDWLTFKGTAHLDQVKQRRDNHQLRDDDATIITIMEMAGLDLDEEVRKGAESDREQRILDMNDASQTLTNEIAERWSQKKYEVVFQADGHHFITFVKDESSRALVPLEERSKGFQWFFSFDMKFMYETEGDFRGAILLLDEPGLHLHAAAQRDLLQRMREYARQNQLVYTTHLPFMIDMNRLDNIWVAEERSGEGTRVHKEWATADGDARFTLQAALGLSWAQSLFVGKKNLVVEGVTDFWFLSTMSTLLKEAGESGLADDLVVTPAGGASKVAYLATLLMGQKLHVAAFLDSDKEGLQAQKQLVTNWLLQDSDVLMLGKVLGRQGSVAIEDLFDEAYYLEHTSAAYSNELNGAPVALPPEPHRSIVDRLETHFGAAGLAFNKGRVAKRIMSELGKKSAADIAPATLDGFRKAIAGVNAVVTRWKE